MLSRAFVVLGHVVASEQERGNQPDADPVAARIAFLPRCSLPPAPQQPPQSMYQMINWSLVLEGCLLLAHTFVLYLFPFTFFISAYWFVFFKLQVGAVPPLAEAAPRDGASLAP